MHDCLNYLFKIFTMCNHDQQKYPLLSFHAHNHRVHVFLSNSTNYPVHSLYPPAHPPSQYPNIHPQEGNPVAPLCSPSSSSSLGHSFSARVYFTAVCVSLSSSLGLACITDLKTDETRNVYIYFNFHFVRSIIICIL